MTSLPAPRRRAPRALVRVGVLVLAFCLSVLGALSLPANSPLGPVAATAATTQSMRIDLTSVTPDTLDAKATVTIAGTVTNTSKKPMKWVSVLMWRDYYPIVSPSDLRYMLQSPADVPMGYRMTSPATAYTALNNDQRPQIEPGESRPFRLSAKVSELRLVDTKPGQVYLLGIHVRGIPGSGENQTLARSRVLMPWQPSTGQQAEASVTPVVQLSSAPSMGLDGTFTDDHLAGQLRNRLDTLMQVAEKPGATVLVDPALYDEVTAMSKGYQLSGEKEKVPDTDPRALAAKAWLARLDAIRAGGSLYRLPYGNPNLSLAAYRRDKGVLDRTVAALPPRHALADLPVAVWLPEGGTLPAATRRFLAPLKPSLWVEPAAEQGQYRLSDGSRVLRYTTAATAGGPGPAPSDSAPQRRGRLLSQMLVDQEPILLPVNSVESAQALLGLPSWVASASAGELSTTPGAPADLKSPQPRERAALISELAWTMGHLDAWQDLTGTSGAEASLSRDQLASRALNAGLDEAGARAWLRTASASVPASFGRQVSLSMAPSFVVGDANSRLPVTITNGSDHPVRVKVQMTSDNESRITIPDTRVVTIPPGESATVTFTPRATGNGVVGFTAQLRTEQGRRVGTPRRFSVNATSFGRIGWMIIIASGAVLLGGTAMRIRQVRDERLVHRAATRALDGAEEGAPTAAPSPAHPDITARPHP